MAHFPKEKRCFLIRIGGADDQKFRNLFNSSIQIYFLTFKYVAFPISFKRKSLINKTVRLKDQANLGARLCPGKL